MVKLVGKQISSLARSIILANPGGIRYGALVKNILEQSPETSKIAIINSVWDLDVRFPNEISKPVRGLFVPVAEPGASGVGPGPGAIELTDDKQKERDFYEPFADWLKDLGEVTEVTPLGDAGLKWKWGTPDVVGTYKAAAGSVVSFPTEIISAEIKSSPLVPVVAFGQALAYRLFSTKTYIAMPITLTEEDKDRLESLCMLFGVGLVLFKLDKNAPDFTIRMRAQRFSPDMFYVNEFADRLKQHNAAIFKKLF